MKKLSLPGFPFEKVAILTRVQRILICVGTLLLLGGAYYYFFYMAKAGTINRLKGTHNALQTKLKKARAAAKEIDKYEKQHKEAEVRFKLALRLLPDKKEIPGLLDGISTSGRRSGLEFLLFKPAEEALQDFYAEIPVKIELTGGYHNIAMFFDRVGRLPRIVNISDINITGLKKGERRLKTSCVATTYRFLDPSEIEPAKEKSRKGKRG
jgi:type IV pilus assembly protein PilO